MSTRRLRVLSVALVVLVLCVPALGVSGQSVDASTSEAHMKGAITIEARVTLPDDPSGVRGIWLGGLGASQGETPSALALVWSEQDTGLLPAWGLQLQSDRGLLPDPPRKRTGTGPLSGSEFNHLKTFSAPQWGHTYESLVSYDPDTGALAVWVWDATAAEEVLNEQLVVPTSTEAFASAAGILTADGWQDRAADLTVYPFYVPRSVRWDLVEVIDGAPSRSASSLFLRNGDGAGVRFTFAGELSGAFQLSLQQGDVSVPLIDVPEPEDGIVYPIDLKTLLAGESLVVLDYVVDGRVWFTETKPINVGSVSLVPDSKPTVVTSDGEQCLFGTVRATGDGPLPEFNLNLNAQVDIPGGSGPLHVDWRSRTYTDTTRVVGVDENGAQISYCIPVGDLDLSGTGEAFVTLDVTTDLDVPVVDVGWSRFVLGQRRAAFPKVGPYTVLRADTHTHTTDSGGVLTATERAWETYAFGYDVLALTDHRSHIAYDSAIGVANDLGLVLIRGMETGLDGREHLVVLDLYPDYRPENEHHWAAEPNADTVFYQDKVREIVEAGGFIIYAHPGGTDFNKAPPYNHPDGPYGWNEEIEWMVTNGYLHGVEIRGHYSPARRAAPFRWALEYGLTMFDGTDVHERRDFDAGRRDALTLIFVEDVSKEGVMDALWAGRTLIWRNGELRGKDEWLQPFMAALIDIRREKHADGSCVRVTNHGAMRLWGSAIGGGGNPSVQGLGLEPYSSACLDFGSEVETVEIQWANVWSAPSQPLRTIHTVQGED